MIDNKVIGDYIEWAMYVTDIAGCDVVDVHSKRRETRSSITFWAETKGLKPKEFASRKLKFLKSGPFINEERARITTFKEVVQFLKVLNAMGV